MSDQNKSISIYIPRPIFPYLNLFNHPYHVVFFTRRCSVPCSYLATDKKFDRNFTQNGFDHLWLDAAQAKELAAKATATLNVKEYDESWASVLEQRSQQQLQQQLLFIESRPKPFRFVAGDESLDVIVEPDLNPPLSSSSVSANNSPPGDATIVGFGPNAHVPMNFIYNAFRDVEDFADEVRANHFGGKPWDRKWLIAAFLSPSACEEMHPSQRAYLKALIELTGMHVYQAPCFANRVFHTETGHIETVEPPLKANDGGTSNEYPPLKESHKVQLSKSYRFILIWEPRADVEGYVTEQVFRSLAYNAVPVIWGPPDLRKLLPVEDCVIVIRDFLQPTTNPVNSSTGKEKKKRKFGNDSAESGSSVEALANRLKEIGGDAKSWNAWMSWKEFVSADPESTALAQSFKDLWSWSADQAVCGVCAKVAEMRGVGKRGDEGGGAEGGDQGASWDKWRRERKKKAVVSWSAIE
ncbi:hypothetical protein HK102_000522 [Quaeritorhiza haematococci]|nr:hypothetical protein HK102_000522 [Quaeritorhiza haematococci]